MLKLLAILLCLLPTIIRANPAEAERIKRSYELSSEKWVLEMKLAATDEARQELMARRPDPVATARELWAQISSDLDKDWTIPYSAFFLETTRNLTTTNADGATGPIFEKERRLALAGFSVNHILKPGIAPFIITLVDGGDPQALPILEKIIKENPDKATQGIAALGASMVLKSLGDDPEIMKKRLTYLRQAIIDSADQTVSGRTVADIVTDELFVIRYLVKGRTAPSLSGTDVGDRIVKLSDYLGKIVVLLFWDASSANTDKVIGLTNQLAEKYKGEPVVVLGVTPEALGRIRTLEGDGSIGWKNIIDPSEKLSKEYRITSRPAVFVIDPTGTIQYTGLPGSFVELTVDALLNPEKPTE